MNRTRSRTAARAPRRGGALAGLLVLCLWSCGEPPPAPRLVHLGAPQDAAPIEYVWRLEDGRGLPADARFTIPLPNVLGEAFNATFPDRAAAAAAGGSGSLHGDLPALTLLGVRVEPRDSADEPGFQVSMLYSTARPEADLGPVRFPASLTHASVGGEYRTGAAVDLASLVEVVSPVDLPTTGGPVTFARILGVPLQLEYPAEE